MVPEGWLHRVRKGPARAEESCPEGPTLSNGCLSHDHYCKYKFRVYQDFFILPWGVFFCCVGSENMFTGQMKNIQVPITWWLLTCRSGWCPQIFCLCGVTPGIQDLQDPTSQQAHDGAPDCCRGFSFLTLLQLHWGCCEAFQLFTRREKCMRLIGEGFFVSW